MRILLISSEWPTCEHPEWVPFIAQRVKHLRKAGVTVEVFPFRGAKNPYKYAKAWVTLRKRHDLHSVDVIDAQFGQSGLLALPSPRPLVVTFHGSDLQGYVGVNGRQTASGRVLRLLSRRVARFADEVVIVSPHLQQHLPPHATAAIIPCGIDLELFRPVRKQEARRQLGLPLERQLILFAANPNNPIKRYQLAKVTVEQLPSCLNADLLTVSNVDHRQMPLYMNACDVLLLTSKHEGSPTIVKEALACNLPVVATDVGDVAMRLRGIEGCYVCTIDDAEAISANLLNAMKYDRLANGRRTVRDLDERILTQKMISIYRRASSHS